MTETSSYLDDVPLEMRHLVSHAAARLHREFEGIFATETIERFIADSWSRVAHARCSPSCHCSSSDSHASVYEL